MSARVVHFEVPFDDGDRARTFYRDVFGWQVNELPELDYTIVTTGPGDETGMPTEPGFIGGGMTQRVAPVAAPVITLAVDDIDATMQAVVEHGGRAITERMPVGDMGFNAYFEDSEGNVMGLWESAAPM